MPKTPSKSDVDRFFHMHDLWTKSHAGQALLSAAILDQELRTSILKAMRPLSNKKQERLFEGFGTLSEFAAKIEIAYALDRIDDDIYGKLRIIKEIRDTFGHKPKELTFFSPEIRDMIKKFNFKGKATYPTIFQKKVQECLDHISGQVSPAP